MRKVIKYCECYECGNRLDIGDDAVEFEGDIFCDEDCVHSHIAYRIDDIEVEEGNCDYEDEGDFDDKDE